jgi:hypothetical protein
MLDKLSAKISHFGNYVFSNWVIQHKESGKMAPAGMVYGLKEA